MFIEEKAFGESQSPSLSGFIAFIESKDPKEQYTFVDSCNCACAQYLKSIGQFDPNWLMNEKSPNYKTMRELNSIAGGLETPNLPMDYNYGTLLTRAKAAA